MTENDYIKASNEIRISAALSIVKDALHGDDYGITKDDKQDIIKKLYDAQTKLFNSYKLEEET